MSAIVTMPTRFGLPPDPSIERQCVRCGATVWLPQRARLDLEDVIVCVVCAMAVVKPGDAISSRWGVLEVEDEQP